MKTTILFTGDSITDHSRDYNDENSMGWGYVFRVANALAENDNVRVINRGISGNRARDLEARWERDCIALKPDIISVMIGINDTWRHFDSNDETADADFYESFRRVLLRTRRELPDAKIMILQPYLLHYPEDRAMWEEDFCGKLAMTEKIREEFADFYIPFNDIMRAEAEKSSPQILTHDGVHPADAGCELMAEKILEILNGSHII